MQVSVSETDQLMRRMTVEVPPDRIENEVKSRLQNMARTARIAGFRPGKIPLQVMESRFGNQVREQVVSEVMRSSLMEALQQEKLQPVGNPEIASRSADRGKGLSYTAVFEIYPQIDAISLDQIRVEKPKVELTDQDIDDMIDKMRRQKQTYVAVERSAGLGDQVTIDFTGTIDGKPFEGGAAQNFPLVLGSNSLIPGFEEGLIGAEAGQERELELQFPTDYRVEDLAGKAVQFKVKIQSVGEGQLPAVDEEFARSFGVADGNLDTMRDEIRKSMDLEVEEGVKTVMKRQLLQAVADKNPVDVPSTLVQKETEYLRMRRSMAQQQGLVGGASVAQNDALLASKALSRAKIHVLLSEIVKKHGLTVSPERLRQTIDNVAAGYDQPEEVVKWYYADPTRLKEMEWLAMEDVVIDWLEAQVEVDERECAFQDLMEKRKALVAEA